MLNYMPKRSMSPSDNRNRGNSERSNAFRIPASDFVSETHHCGTWGIMATIRRQGRAFLISVDCRDIKYVCQYARYFNTPPQDMWEKPESTRKSRKVDQSYRFCISEVSSVT